MLGFFFFSNFFFKVRPVVLNKVFVIKCQRPPAKCWSRAAFKVWSDLYNISSYINILSLPKSKVNYTTKYFFFCVWTQIVAHIVFFFLRILNQFLTCTLSWTIIGGRNSGSRQFSFSAALSGTSLYHLTWCVNFRSQYQTV